MELASQKLMNKVYARVSGRVGMGKEYHKVYSRWAKQLPSLVQVSGLAQAITFQESKAIEKLKDEPARQALLEDLSTVLSGSATGLREKIISHDTDVFEYIKLTREAQNALTYFKRFSISLFGLDEADTAGGD